MTPALRPPGSFGSSALTVPHGDNSPAPVSLDLSVLPDCLGLLRSAVLLCSPDPQSSLLVNSLWDLASVLLCLRTVILDLQCGEILIDIFCSLGREELLKPAGYFCLPISSLCLVVRVALRRFSCGLIPLARFCLFPSKFLQFRNSLYLLIVYRWISANLRDK